MAHNLRETEEDEPHTNTNATEQTPLLTPPPTLASTQRKQSITDALLSRTLSNSGDSDTDAKSVALTSPQTWRSESLILLAYSLPLIPTYLLQYFYSVVTIFVAGHISSDALAAASIASTTTVILGYAVFEGMATALDTLCAQAYGSGNLKGVGLHVQRMILLMGAFGILVAAFWIASPWLLPFVLKQENIAILAGRFMQITLIGLPGYAVFEAMKRFVQAQGDFTSSLLVLIVCAPINVFLNWLFVFRFGWGLNGTALAAALTNLCRPLLLLLYILTTKRWTLQCWGGFSRSACRNWGPMVQLSVAGSLLNLSEWAAFEVLTFSSSYISAKHISAQTILSTESILVWHIPFSVGVAVTTRVGHLIGSGAIKSAKRVLTFYAIVFVAIGLFDGMMVWLLRNHVPRFFTDDKEVQDIAIAVTPFVATFQIIDSIIAGTSGVLRGFGKQSIAAWASTAINYLAAVPIAVWLMLGSPRLELRGSWLSLQLGMVCLGVVEVLSLKVIDWQKCIEVAQSRNSH